MAIIERMNNNGPSKVRVLDTFIEFNKEGKAHTDDKRIIDIFKVVPGYNIIDNETTKVEEEPKKEADKLTLEDFNSLSWQKQKAVIDKGEASNEIITHVLDNQGDYTNAVVKSAQAIFEG